MCVCVYSLVGVVCRQKLQGWYAKAVLTKVRDLMKVRTHPAGLCVCVRVCACVCVCVRVCACVCPS